MELATEIVLCFSSPLCCQNLSLCRTAVGIKRAGWAPVFASMTKTVPMAIFCREGHTFLSRAVWGLGRAWEDYFSLTVSPVVFAGIEGCCLNAWVLLWHFAQFMLWDAHIPETGGKTTYGWEIHPNTRADSTRDVIWEVSRTSPQQV